MEFEWDEAKDVENRRKHGLGLAHAVGLDWAGADIAPDKRKDYGEARSVAIADLNGRLHVCVFVWRGVAKRIISLRKANSREVRRHGPD